MYTMQKRESQDKELRERESWGGGDREKREYIEKRKPLQKKKNKAVIRSPIKLYLQ